MRVRYAGPPSASFGGHRDIRIRSASPGNAAGLPMGASRSGRGHRAGGRCGRGRCRRGPGRGRGSVQVDYPSLDCPQPDGLQGCIDRVDPRTTIRVTTEIVGEAITITKAIRLLGAPDLQPQLDRIDVTGTTAVIDVTLRGSAGPRGDLGGAGHHRRPCSPDEHVDRQGSIPNTGSAITMQTTVPATFILERSTITGGAPGRDSVRSAARSPMAPP